MKKDYKLQIIDYKIGLRTYKTGLAVFICLILTFPFAHHVALFSSLAAVICMKETNKDTLAAGTNRMFGTIIGGVLAYIYLSLVSAVSFLDGWPSKIIISALIIVCIYLCNIFKMKGASVICCAVFLVVVLAHHDNAKVLTYVGIRVLATLLGIAVSIVVNRFIAPLANTSNDTEESK
ncbi:MAG: FUSC family protein [Clostridiales bacterium]|nr:FUSC family protein [Clostridiales bacterium]